MVMVASNWFESSLGIVVNSSQYGTIMDRNEQTSHKGRAKCLECFKNAKVYTIIFWNKLLNWKTAIRSGAYSRYTKMWCYFAVFVELLSSISFNQLHTSYNVVWSVPEHYTQSIFCAFFVRVFRASFIVNLLCAFFFLSIAQHTQWQVTLYDQICNLKFKLELWKFQISIGRHMSRT